MTRVRRGPDGLDARTRVALAQAPLWALERELASRRFRPKDTAVTFGDLTVDPVHSCVTWGHDAYRVRGRQMEVVYALAVARRRGYFRVPGVDLAQSVWRGMDAHTACTNLRSYVNALNKRIPGLVLLSGTGRVGYGLAVPDDDAQEESA
jgi:DNA-binding response OmpR family regulator